MTKCCICGEEIHGFGNNPWPVDKTDEARCCDACNASTVVPARLADMVDGNKKKGKKEMLTVEAFIDKKTEMLIAFEAAKRVKEQAAEKMSDFVCDSLVDTSVKGITEFIDEARKNDDIEFEDVLAVVGTWSKMHGYEVAFVKTMNDFVEMMEDLLGGE